MYCNYHVVLDCLHLPPTSSNYQLCQMVRCIIFCLQDLFSVKSSRKTFKDFKNTRFLKKET